MLSGELEAQGPEFDDQKQLNASKLTGLHISEPSFQRADNAIQRRNRSPAEKCWQNLLRYPPVRGSSVDNAIQPVNNRGRHTNSLSFLGLAFDSVSNNQRTTRTDYRKKGLGKPKLTIVE